VLRSLQAGCWEVLTQPTTQPRPVTVPPALTLRLPVSAVIDLTCHGVQLATSLSEPYQPSIRSLEAELEDRQSPSEST
jgi:hypothetical protein